MSAEIANEVSQGVLGTLGINWKLFLGQLINFAIVLFVLWRWVWKPVIKVLDERSKKIEQSIANAKKIEEEMQGLENIKKQILRESEEKAQALIAEAELRAEEKSQESILKARTEVEKLVHQGKEQLQNEKIKIVDEAKLEIADLVVAATAKVIEEDFGEKKDEKLVRKILDKI